MTGGRDPCFRRDDIIKIFLGSCLRRNDKRGIRKIFIKIFLGPSLRWDDGRENEI